jgi:branched-chain amino acid transport system ATP-binding protein
VEGEILFVAVLKALSAYEFMGESEFPPFRDAVLRYTAFERDHAMKEEQEILPRAAEALVAADWEEIDAAFEENQDPLFGNRWRSEFSELMERLVNRLPAPLGLGDIWK